MRRRLDGKWIQPSDLTPDVYEGSSIVENIVLASSNHLREYFGLQEGETLPGPIPKFVTRKNSSLDNYFADLLLRTCYEPVDYLPAYEEHVIRGSQEELPSDLNPRLVDSVLIGIGGRSSNPDFKKVYDEHTEVGTQSAKSASQVVFQEHLERYHDHPGVQSIQPIQEEINYIDSEGGVFYDHIFTITKNLHYAQFRQPGFVSESLEAQWKRAIIEAALMSVCISVEVFENFDNQKAIETLEQEWNLYLGKSEKLRENGFVDPVEPEVVEYVKGMIHNQTVSEVKGKASYFTHRRILFALERVWDQKVVSFIMSFLFEAMLQAQQSFVNMQKNIEEGKVPLRSLPGNHAFIYHQREPLDKRPHTGILYRMNDRKRGKKAIVIVHDPVRQITSVFKNNYLRRDTWKRFCDLLIEKEGNEVWYVITHEDGTIANFVLNGTESFVGVPMTKLSENDFFELFKTAIESPTPNS